MADKILSTRISLKYGAIGDWSSGFKPLQGEVCFAQVQTAQKDATTGNVISVPAVVFKVGDGAHTFGQLPWASAMAADVYAWAKKEKLELVDLPADGAYTDTNTTYAFEVPAEGDNKGKLVITPTTNGTAGAATVLDFVTPDELTTALANYYTKGEVDGIIAGYYTKGEVDDIVDGYYTKDEVDGIVVDKLHTEAEIKAFAAAEINRLIDAADPDDDGRVLKEIGDLIDYVNNNAGEIAGLVTSVGTANTNASAAVETANGAAQTASNAAQTAGEAKTLAEEAKQAAIDATTGAAASAEAAAASAAQASADAAAAASAKSGAETAQRAAEAAQAAAEASNTSATAIANEAKTAAEGAVTTAGEAKTTAEGVANTIAGYGDIVTHNVAEFATAAQGTAADTAVQSIDMSAIGMTATKVNGVVTVAQDASVTLILDCGGAK